MGRLAAQHLLRPHRRRALLAHGLELGVVTAEGGEPAEERQEGHLGQTEPRCVWGVRGVGGEGGSCQARAEC